PRPRRRALTRRAVVLHFQPMPAFVVDEAEVVLAVSLAPTRQGTDDDAKRVALRSEHILRSRRVVAVETPRHHARSFQRLQTVGEDARGDAFNALGQLGEAGVTA